MNAARGALVAGLAAAGVLPWLLSENLPKLVADRRDVLLGRYGVDDFAFRLAATAASWTAAWLLWRFGQGRGRAAVFRLVAVALAVLVTAAVVETGARLVREPRYVIEETALPGDDSGPRVAETRRRQPGLDFPFRYVDRPPTARTFPGAVEGHPPVEGRFVSDRLGFRNRERGARYEVLTVGDSFVEGAKADQDRTWPARLAARSGRSLYNLGVGGAEVVHYESALRAFGFDLEPDVVIVMIYEGNDFARARGADDGAVEGWVESSPVLRGLGRALVRMLGPIGADAPIPGGDFLAWMPVAAPPGPGAHPYVFRPKRLLQLLDPPDAFRASAEWRDTAAVLARIHDACERRGVRLVLAYAPSKPHVVMPLVVGHVPSEHLHAYLALKADDLPSSEALAATLPERVEAQEAVVREFARERGIAFASTTAALRASVAAGEMPFFTWDPHWTPLGHERVAEVLLSHLVEPARSAPPEAAPSPAAPGGG